MQGRVTRVDPKTRIGYIRPDGWTGEVSYRHWAVVHESHNPPAAGDYVQFMFREDHAGRYVSEVRVLTPPTDGPALPDLTKRLDRQEPGIKRLDGDQVKTMEQVSAEARTGKPGIRRSAQPRSAHQMPTPVSTDWDIPE